MLASSMCTFSLKVAINPSLVLLTVGEVPRVSAIVLSSASLNFMSPFEEDAMVGSSYTIGAALNEIGIPVDDYWTISYPSAAGSLQWGWCT